MFFIIFFWSYTCHQWKRNAKDIHPNNNHWNKVFRVIKKDSEETIYKHGILSPTWQLQKKINHFNCNVDNYQIMIVKSKEKYLHELHQRKRGSVAKILTFLKRQHFLQFKKGVEKHIVTFLLIHFIEKITFLFSKIKKSLKKWRKMWFFH